MDRGEKINEFINDIYKGSFYRKYGLSFLISFVFIIIVIFVIYYDYFKKNIDRIRNNWDNERCVPLNMPFASMAMPPKDGKSDMEFIFDNFKFCVDGIMKTAVDVAVSPIQMSLRGLTSFYKSISESLNLIWEKLVSTRNSLFEMANNIVKYVKSILAYLLIIIYKVKDTISKSTAVLATGFHFLMTIYNSIRSFFGSFYQIVELALASLIVMMISFFMVPFFVMWPAGIFLFTSITLVVVFMKLYENAVSPYIKLKPGVFKVPDPGSFCFGYKTKIQLLDKSYKNISNVNPGDILHDGSTVTSFFRLKNCMKKIYNIGNNIYVTGEHVMIIDDKFVRVKETNLGDFEIFTDKYLYCLNTNTKRIRIDGYVFTDYDEISKDEENTLMRHFNIDNKLDYWKYYEGGFCPDIMIEMNDGSIKRMGDVKVGDLLKGKVEVLGVINGIERNCKYYNDFWDVKHNILLSSDNVLIKTNFGDSAVSIEKRSSNHRLGRNKNSETVHFITSKHFFYIGHLSFWDFDSMTEYYLE